MRAPRLMIVDDEVAVAELIRRVSTQLGFEAVATSEPGSFRQLYNDQFDVVLLDLVMPQIDGIELLRFLADVGCRAQLILASGFDIEVLNAARNLAVGRGLRVVGTLTKPFHVTQLEGLLLSTIGTAPVRTPGPTPLAPTYRELRHAIDERQLVVYFQPKVSFANRALVSAEALVRWIHPERGLISPGAFIPLAEQTGLIGDLTQVVLADSADQCRRWSDEGIDISIAVNVSAGWLDSLDIPEQILSVLEQSGLPPSKLVIEVTETSVAGEVIQALDVLTRLRMRGVQLSIDDFGTGYSSLQQLQIVPFNELKLDVSYVRRAHEHASSRAIVETTIDLGHRLGKTVVAEGVENEEIWHLLAGLGCDLAQGYFIARPMPGEHLSSWLAQWKRRFPSQTRLCDTDPVSE